MLIIEAAFCSAGASVTVSGKASTVAPESLITRIGSSSLRTSV
jgi:hypothetical protein